MGPLNVALLKKAVEKKDNLRDLMGIVIVLMETVMVSASVYW